MQSLAERVFPLTGYRSIGDLAWNYALSYDRQADHCTALWRAGGDVLAWGWVERPSELMLQIDPAHAGLADEVLDWAEQLASVPLQVGVAGTETAVADALIRRGYLRQDGPFFCCLGMRLADTLASPRLPAGYRIREVSGDKDAAGWVAVHRSAFPGSRFDAARRSQLMRVHPYRPDLDLVVEAPDGSLAAYCLGWYDQRNRVGEFEPVGTHPEHRRLGLAAAVNTAVLHRFTAAGGQRAVVYARGDAAYPVPRRLYESLGFREHTRTSTFSARS
jgi:ribosomal protein S18 acetylase RimI-like enzyme